MPIGNIRTRDVVVASRDTTVNEVARLMRSHHVGDVVVVDEVDGRQVPCGIITDQNDREVRSEIRECRRELREADSRREYEHERRECQREIARARNDDRYNNYGNYNGYGGYGGTYGYSGNSGFYDRYGRYYRYDRYGRPYRAGW